MLLSANIPLKKQQNATLKHITKYIDFQYLISGKEKMGGVTTLDKVVPICEYDEEKDIVFFKPDASAIYEVATPDLFYVFLP